MSLWSWLMEVAEPDPENYFGVGPFKPLPKDHPFQRAAFLHDWAFNRARAGDDSLSLADEDAKLFWRLVMLAYDRKNPAKSCELFLDICKYWPIARKCGGLFWSGKK